MTKHNRPRSDSEIEAAITLYEKAIQLLARGLSEQALILFSQVIDQAPWLIPAYSGAGAASLEHGLWQQTFDLATEGLKVLAGTPSDKDSEQELTRQHSMLLSQKAAALSGLGQHRQAIELAKETYTHYPSPQTLIELGTTLALAGKLDEAEEHYAIALLETESPAMAMIAYNNMAVLLERQGDFDAALKYFQRACAVNPDDSQAKVELATALAERGHYDEALNTLVTITYDDPHYNSATHCEEIIYHGQQFIQLNHDSITSLEKELAPLKLVTSNSVTTANKKITTSSKALTYLDLAIYYLSARQRVTAILLMQKGLALDPQNIALITTLTDTFLRNRLIQLAIPILNEALITHPDNPQIMSLQTLILARTHEHTKARHFFTTSTTLLVDKHTTFCGEPWELSPPSNRLLPSELKSYEYLVAAACEMKDWPLAIESLFSGLDLHLQYTLPHNRESKETRIAVQNTKPFVLDQANLLINTALNEDPQTVASLALILYNLNSQYDYPPLEVTIETLVQVIPESEELLNQLLVIQSAFTSDEEDADGN